MSRRTRLSMFAALSLAAVQAQAQTVVFKENWENGTTSWRTTAGNGTDLYLQDSGATAGTPVVLVTPAADTSTCAGNYAEEGAGRGKASVGGRVFMTGAKAISVAAAGEQYCVAAWVRGGPGSSPSLGINYIKKSVGYSDTRVAGAGYRNGVYREHWLALTGGGYADGYLPWARSNSNPNPALRDKPASDTRAEGPVGTKDSVLYDVAAQQAAYGNAVPVTLGAGWALAKAHFTVTEQDLKPYELPAAGGTDVPADAFVVKFGNFSGSGTAGVYNTTTAANFGDIVVVKLAAGATDCPDDAFFAPITSVHKACEGTTPLCVTTGTGDNARSSCGACDASKGESGTQVCGDNKPVCAKTGANQGACQACTGDNGTPTQACASANPYCRTLPGAPNVGTCGKCTQDSECQPGTGGLNHAGLSCDVPTGACVTGCLNDTDCAATNGWCDGATPPNVAGKCKPKLANGNAIPASRNGICTTANGTALCESGRCDTDGKCGLVNASECANANQCRGGVCDNAKCGRADEGSCTKDEECLGNQCTAGKCMAPCASDAECGSATSGQVCDATTGACAAGCRGAGGNGCATGQVCSSTDTSVGKCAASPTPVAPSSDAKSGCSTTPSSGGSSFAAALALVAGGLVRRRFGAKKRA